MQLVGTSVLELWKNDRAGFKSFPVFQIYLQPFEGEQATAMRPSEVRWLCRRMMENIPFVSLQKSNIDEAGRTF